MFLRLGRGIEQGDIELCKTAPDLLQKGAAGRRWADAVAMALEQLDADQYLQAFNTSADGGCRHPDRCAGLVETALPGCNQGLEQGDKLDVPDHGRTPESIVPVPPGL